MQTLLAGLAASGVLLVVTAVMVKMGLLVTLGLTGVVVRRARAVLVVGADGWDFKG